MGGSGSTTTTGIIPPELRGLYNSSAQALVGQQGANPLGQYNAENPLQVAGSDPMQQYGASLIGGGAQPSGLDALTLQSILRSTGLAGAGPTTGQYDYGSEAGLGDIMSFLQPYQLQSPGLENAPRALGSAGFTNADPSSTPPPNDYSGLGPALAGGGGGNYGAPGGQLPPGTPGTPTSNGGQMTPKSGQSYNGPVPMSAPLGRGMGGQTISDLNALLKPYGGNANFSMANGSGQVGLNVGGQSYMNQGASHEGGGPGGESAFLSDVLGKAHGANNPNAMNTDVAAIDQASASARALGGRAQGLGLDPNTASYQDIAKASLAQRAAGPQPGDANFANNPASWAGHARTPNPPGKKKVS